MKIAVVVAVCAALTSCSALRTQSRIHVQRNRGMALRDAALISSSIDAFHHAIQHIDVHALHTTLNLADADVAASAVGDAAAAVAVPPPAAAAASSGLYKVDKTGFVGFVADLFEQAIDLLHNVAKGTGATSTYGLAIVFFTFLIKAATLPLTMQQLESTTKMQKLAPLQQKIQAKYPNKEDEQTKNQMVAQLFQTANVNPLAGCLPALVQIPVFISLYRALQNLVAENKLDEPFLWIPDLEGPVYTSGAGESMNWFYSIFSGNPSLGWDDTRAFLSLPIILFISQTISTKILQPARDPNKPMTEQEQFSQGLVNNLPFIVAFFSLNVPAGLGIYWITNNILTTLITLAVKASLKDEAMPAEVAQMMAALDAPAGGAAVKTRGPSSSSREMMRSTVVEDSKKVGGFGATLKAIDVEGSVAAASAPEAGAGAGAAAAASDDDEDDGDDDDEEDDKDAAASTSDAPKRKKRTKPASKKGKKRA